MKALERNNSCSAALWYVFTSVQIEIGKIPSGIKFIRKEKQTGIFMSLPLGIGIGPLYQSGQLQ